MSKNSLVVYNGSSSVAYGEIISNELQNLCEPFLMAYRERGLRNPSLTLYTSMVYGFAKHLPYSMDIMQPEYVPGIFLDMEPKDVNENNWFKWEDRRTFFNSMIRWGDTFRSGMLLQVCYLFQEMLLGNVPSDYVLDKESFYNLGIDKFTSNMKYNRNFFSVIQTLPHYYQLVTQAKTQEERRKQLENMYEAVCIGIENRVGGFAEYNEDGSVKRKYEANIRWDAYRDVELRIYFEGITWYDGVKELIAQIKEEQLNRIRERSLDRASDTKLIG